MLGSYESEKQAWGWEEWLLVEDAPNYLHDPDQSLHLVRYSSWSILKSAVCLNGC
jgi:hypothetical protein